MTLKRVRSEVYSLGSPVARRKDFIEVNPIGSLLGYLDRCAILDIPHVTETADKHRTTRQRVDIPDTGTLFLTLHELGSDHIPERYYPLFAQVHFQYPENIDQENLGIVKRMIESSGLVKKVD
ncbi:MAG: hypothetical protein WC796_05260 [Candidatus Pacearchaeota archaeon]|jgi:hypothetical protein